MALPRLQEKYRTQIKKELCEKNGYKNIMQVPTFTKVVVNMGVGAVLKNEKELQEAIQDLTLVTGQKPQTTRARKSIATWRLREGQPIGARVTLRGARMWEFIDRLVSLAIPRIKDFRGMSLKSFDGKGNYSLGIQEKAIFPEIRQDKMEFRQGMDITFVTSAVSDDEALMLMKALGFPFRKN
ncbi:MAG: 50S ribosomal protein L5 [Planctomycetota bacterium]